MSVNPDDSDTSSMGEIPNFLMLKQIPVDYIQRVETDLLEPVVFNQGNATTDGFTRFTLQNKGFLHSHSKLFVTLKPPVGLEDAYLAPHVGIGQIIKKAVLKIGNKQVNELDSWAGLYAVKSSVITNESNLEREQYMTGRVMSHGFRYNEGSKALADTYGLDNGVEYQADDLVSPEWAKMDGRAPAECPNYMIDLSDLFPFLKVHQLPLFMITEPINIELTFVPTKDERVQITSGETADQLTEIVRDELKFCADYIYYGAGDEMERFAQANQDMSFSFVDYRVVEHSTTSNALASGIVRNLGMANRLVPRIVATMVRSGDSEETILGQYNAVAPFVAATGEQSALKYNVRYNDRYEFTSDIENTARMFSTFTDSESVPFVTREEYSGQGVNGGITTDQYNGRDQFASLSTRFFYMGTRLTSGRVGQRGIELHLTANTGDANIDLLRCYCEYLRTARLRNGIFEIYNA